MIINPLFFIDNVLKQIINSWTHNPASLKIIYPGEMEKLKQIEKNCSTTYQRNQMLFSFKRSLRWFIIDSYKSENKKIIEGFKKLLSRMRKI